jgi:hypothetical protein
LRAVTAGGSQVGASAAVGPAGAVADSAAGVAVARVLALSSRTDFSIRRGSMKCWGRSGQGSAGPAGLDMLNSKPTRSSFRCLLSAAAWPLGRSSASATRCRAGGWSAAVAGAPANAAASPAPTPCGAAVPSALGPWSGDGSASAASSDSRERLRIGRRPPSAIPTARSGGGTPGGAGAFSAKGRRRKASTSWSRCWVRSPPMRRTTPSTCLAATSSSARPSRQRLAPREEVPAMTPAEVILARTEQLASPRSRPRPAD